MEGQEKDPLLNRAGHLRSVLRNINTNDTDHPSADCKSAAAAVRANLADDISTVGQGITDEAPSTNPTINMQPPQSSLRAVLDWEVDERMSLGGVSSRSASTAPMLSSASFQRNDIMEDAHDMSDWMNVSSGNDSSHVPDPDSILQACVFVEDAIHYRSIHHRVDRSSLVIYRIYYSMPLQLSIYFTIAVIHMLAFFEFPSSLTSTADIRSGQQRPRLPCGVTESIELICLLVFLSDAIMKSYFAGREQFRKQYWLFAYFSVVLISLLDWVVSMSLLCHDTVRIRRMLRPFFLLQNSSLMKKTVKSLRKTMPHVVSVLLLLVMHLYFFTLFAMLLFPKPIKIHDTNITSSEFTDLQYGMSAEHETSAEPETAEEQEYFSTLTEGVINLLVLLTTANNPDVTMPAYNENRFYAIFFIIYLVIGLYCIMNMLTAVIYNQFRGYFTESIQTSLFRRCLAIRAAFEVLRMRRVSLRFRSSFSTSSASISTEHLRLVLMQANMKKAYRDAMLIELEKHPPSAVSYSLFQEIFVILDADLNKKPRPPLPDVSHAVLRKLQRICSHQYFNYAACVAATINVICLTLELHYEFQHIRSSKDTYLGLVNLVFAIYYAIEQSLKLWALGWRRYCWDHGNIFDGFITVVLVIVEIVYISLFGLPFHASNLRHHTGITLWDLVRVTNMLILIRLLRLIVSQIKTMFVVASTLLDLMKNLRAFAGLMVVIFYSYALLGMELFSDKIYLQSNITENSTDYSKVCGSYEQLEYWANNFDDFAAALVVLWDAMIVNNWHIFLHVYSRFTNSWSQLYFIFWWLVSVVIAVNLFTALLLENFIMRWDRQLSRRREPSQAVDFDSYQTSYMTVHDMFRDVLQVPSEDSLLVELRLHPHFSQS